MTYLWLQAFHIIAVICWFAGIFYLPRLFVYHASAEDSVSRERFCVMESKLYRIIMTPSMIATLIFGGIMLVARWGTLSGELWLWLKLLLVAGLLGYHHYCGRLIKAFAAAPEQSSQPKSERFFRIFNELPVLALIIIVILAVVKPF